MYICMYMNRNMNKVLDNRHVEVHILNMYMNRCMNADVKINTNITIFGSFAGQNVRRDKKSGDKTSFWLII